MPQTQTTLAATLLPDFGSAAAAHQRKWRNIRDIGTRYLMAAGGISVILAIVLIAFYLLYVVLPMFRPAHIEQIAEYALPGGAQNESLYYALEEQREIGLRVTAGGELVFFRTGDGHVVDKLNMPAPVSSALTAFAAGAPAQGLLAFGLADGTTVLAGHDYEVSYPDDVRLISPAVHYPFGPAPLPVVGNGQAISLLSAQWDGEQATIAALSRDARLWLVSLVKEESFLGDETAISRSTTEIPYHYDASHLALDIEQRELYVVDTQGFISYFDVSNKSEPRLMQRVKAVPDNVEITSLQFLSGGISILVGDSRGRITQWFPVRDAENNYTLESIRYFESQDAPIVNIAAEYFRKGFVATDSSGQIGLYHTTAHRTVKLEQPGKGNLTRLAIAPRANAMLVEDSTDQLQFWDIDNEHPEISWSSIWGRIWYESRDRHEYIWQSSSASSDFEPKFSLTPLVFGTMKAAFYAMLFAVPLAIFGAIYTAYFMSSTLRSVVKPTIEIMEALPTVILGFLAGLWFAPLVESYMPGLFAYLVLLPLMMVLAAYAWQFAPARMRHIVPEGWEAALLVPVIILTGLIAFYSSQPLERLMFAGNMPLWLSDELGIDYDQRNSLVVGIAMGFAVIPTIFSISEDAVYSVPGHLTTGSLALGATRWQTMIRIVLLTASPGIFSAIMIGLGRAVGETMIVVMATGNTAIMDMNIFAGFRALSANIAVEMPESEVGGTHYRILFLAALVLFMTTFLFNTVAELVRQRLRTKYSNL